MVVIYRSTDDTPWPCTMSPTPGLCAVEHPHPKACGTILTRLCSAPPFAPGLGIAKMTHSDYQAAAAD